METVDHVSPRAVCAANQLIRACERGAIARSDAATVTTIARDSATVRRRSFLR